MWINDSQASKPCKRLAPQPYPSFEGDTLVLDFVNDRQEIREAFKTYYEGVKMGEEVDPAHMYQIKSELDAAGVYLAEEVARFCDAYFKPKQRQSAMDHQAMNTVLDPAVSRFTVRQRDAENEAELWRGKTQDYRNLVDSESGHPISRFRP